MVFGANSTDVVARRALMGALETLQPHLDSLILVGAQAVYLNSNHIELPLAPATSDADIAFRQVPPDLPISFPPPRCRAKPIAIAPKKTVDYYFRMAKTKNYILAGVAVAAANFLVYSYLVLSGSSFYLASLVGSAAGLFLAFILQRRLVFKEFDQVGARLIRHVWVYVAQIGISLTLLTLVIEGLRANPILAYCVVAAIVTPATYFAQNYITFRKVKA
jgi:putative flippase GtrA